MEVIFFNILRKINAEIVLKVLRKFKSPFGSKSLKLRVNWQNCKKDIQHFIHHFWTLNVFSRMEKNIQEINLKNEVLNLDQLLGAQKCRKLWCWMQEEELWGYNL